MKKTLFLMIALFSCAFITSCNCKSGCSKGACNNAGKKEKCACNTDCGCKGGQASCMNGQNQDCKCGCADKSRAK